MEYYEDELYSTWVAEGLYALEALRNITTVMVGAAILCLDFGNTACIVGGIAVGPIIALMEYNRLRKRMSLRNKSREGNP